MSSLSCRARSTEGGQPGRLATGASVPTHALQCGGGSENGISQHHPGAKFSDACCPGGKRCSGTGTPVSTQPSASASACSFSSRTRPTSTTASSSAQISAVSSQLGTRSYDSNGWPAGPAPSGWPAGRADDYANHACAGPQLNTAAVGNATKGPQTLNLQLSRFGRDMLPPHLP